MKVDKVKFAAPYYPTVAVKDKILLHFTVGSSVVGAVASWNSIKKSKGYCMGTPDIIDRDGTLYQVWDPQFWAYHIGVSDAVEKSTIGIELVNWGPLAKNADGSFSPIDLSVNKLGKKAVTVPVTEVVTLKKPISGVLYWHAFTEAQIKATNERIKQHCKTFDIPKKLPPKDKIGVYDLEFFTKFSGLVTHTNFRKDKYDIGPLWDWERTIKEIS